MLKGGDNIDSGGDKTALGGEIVSLYDEKMFAFGIGDNFITDFDGFGGDMFCCKLRGPVCSGTKTRGLSGMLFTSQDPFIIIALPFIGIGVTVSAGGISDCVLSQLIGDFIESDSELGVSLEVSSWLLQSPFRRLASSLMSSKVLHSFTVKGRYIFIICLTSNNHFQRDILFIFNKIR